MSLGYPVLMSLRSGVLVGKEQGVLMTLEQGVLIGQESGVLMALCCRILIIPV